MKKTKPVFDTSALGAMSLDQVEENNRKVRAQANPLVRGMMDDVQDAIDKENDLMDAQAEGHAKLRAWAQELLGFKISMTQIEHLKNEVTAAKPGKPFSYQDQLLIKTAFGTVDRLDRYVFTLEKTIVDLTSKSAAIPTLPIKEQFTELSSFGLIKLALNRLFKRSK